MSSWLLFKNFALFGSDLHDFDKPTRIGNSNTFCVLVHKNIIAAVGTEQECVKEHLKSTHADDDELQIVDGGKYTSLASQQLPPLLSPGFIDSHAHLLDGGGRLAYVLDMSAATTRQEFTDAITRHKYFIFGEDADLHANKGSEWLFGSGWDDEYLGGLPTKDWIDELEPERPVFLYRCDMHTAVVNSAALRICGIDRNSAQPEGGVIEHDAKGDPSGVLRDRAIWDARQRFPKTLAERLSQALVAATSRFHATGITCVHDMSTMDVHTNTEEFLFLRNQFRENKLKIRMRTSIRVNEFDEAVAARVLRKSADNHQGDSEEEEGPPPPNSTEESRMLRLCFLKMFTDGSLGSRTARMHQPYAPRTGECHDELYKQAHKGCQCGVYVRTYDDLAAGVVKARQHILLPCLHAIGDAAVTTALDAFESSCSIPQIQLAEPFNCPFAGRIEHCQHILSKDCVRMRSLNVVASVQPMHMSSDAVVAERVLGQWRRSGAFPLATLLRQCKVHMAFGSDWPVVTQCPAKAMFAATTRRAHWEALPKMNVVAEEVPSAATAWDRRQCLTVRECLHNYTAAAAESCPGDATFLGRLRVGYAADFVILSPLVTKLLIMKPDDVSNPLVDSHNKNPVEGLNEAGNVYLETWVNGEKVFSKD